MGISNAEEFVEINAKQGRNREAFSGWRKVWGVVGDNDPNIQAVEYAGKEIVDESPPCLVENDSDTDLNLQAL